MTARALARETHIPGPTVVKLLKILTARGALHSIQGRGGGYRLARNPSEILLTDMIEAVDGPIALTECNRQSGDCQIQSSCLVRGHWAVINEAIRQSLASVSLADLAVPLQPNRMLMRAAPRAGATDSR